MVAGVGDFLSSPLLVTNHPAKTGAGAGPPVLLYFLASSVGLFLIPSLLGRILEQKPSCSLLEGPGASVARGLPVHFSPQTVESVFPLSHDLSDTCPVLTAVLGLPLYPFLYSRRLHAAPHLDHPNPDTSVL